MWKGWRLFHATDFQSLMYPCFTFGRILGLFPYKINASTIEVSKQCYILSTVIICICCIFDLLLIHDFITKINLKSVIRTLEGVSYYTFTGFIVIVTHILNGPRMRLLQTILDISSKLPPESYQKLSRLIHIKDIFGIILIVVQLCAYFLKADMDEINYATAMPMMFSTGFFFTVYLTLQEFHINMLYVNSVCVLKACFKRINENVAYMQELIVNDTKPSVSKWTCYFPRNQFLLINLKSLKKQHLMVSDAVKMLNIIFSLQLLATIIMCFCNITFELYFYAVRWQNGLFIRLSWDFLDMFFITLMFHITKIILLVWVCETGKNQAKEIGTTIHDVLNKTSDGQLKDELQLFSLQILHRDNTFSAKGLTVDATLLATMVGNITTYMLILIQFLVMLHSCDKKPGTNIINNSVI
ncbi:PREDICTED: putative gustatory receptor 28a [Vollenhovia emeryi]|uniref:putative gustatory receptor 28a n=1 Tax=Vollenhovia emeryi TaxID=411798 RepID=UPI0005F53769|nr:PREDICTED: putative gustatory receptor 28a [Vollenhovia emeryi]